MRGSFQVTVLSLQMSHIDPFENIKKHCHQRKNKNKTKKPANQSPKIGFQSIIHCLVICLAPSLRLCKDTKV